MSLNCCAVRLCAGSPSMRASPACGNNKPVMIFSRVVLPAPLRPSNPYRWPGSNCQFTPLNNLRFLSYPNSTLFNCIISLFFLLVY